jgi:hypothetical protein
MLRRRPALHKDLPYYAALACAVVAFQYYIISGRRHFPFCYAAYHFPLLHYARHWLIQGALPLYEEVNDILLRLPLAKGSIALFSASFLRTSTSPLPSPLWDLLPL